METVRRGQRIFEAMRSKGWTHTIDLNGEALKNGQKGWYYGWWRGLHYLCGKEGADASVYNISPSHESFSGKNEAIQARLM